MMIKILKLKLVAIIFIIFILSCLNIPGYADDMKVQKNVLVVNSYHQGLTWTNDEAAGIIGVLKSGYDNSSIFVEYMDWKNHPTSENIRYLYDYFKYKYQNTHIDILIATDDAALEFVLKNRGSLFSNAPVVFCGVNKNGVDRLTKGYKNVTGVIEEIDPVDTVKIALEVNPSLKTVYVLYDNSESGTSTGKLVIDEIKSMRMNLNIVSLNKLPYDELIRNVSSYNKDAIILVTTYYSDVNGKIIEFERVSREISKNSSVPVYHLYDFSLNNGAFGGNMMSGRLQGTSAANLAVRILNGENPDNIAVLSPKTTRKVFDFQQLKRFNIPLNRIPKDSEIINKPFSFFETYKTLVLSVLAAFIVLIIFVCILLMHIRQIRKMKKKLSDSNEELTQLYEELAASDEELKQQFDEISSMQESLANSEQRFRVAVDGSNAVVWDLDMLNMQYYFSDRFYELLGYEKDEIGESHGGWKAIIHPEDVPEADKARNFHLAGETPFYNCEYRMKIKSGEYKWFNVRGKILQDERGKNIRFAGSLIDITDRKEYETKLQQSYQELEATYEELAAAEEELKQQFDEILNNNEKIRVSEERFTYLAYHDSLTGLPNKLSLYENLNKEVLLPANTNLALLFIDMDNFKYINDTLGHDFGDQLIIKASERLNSLLKENCTIYRLGGDEFIIIMQGFKEKEEAEIFALHILAGFKEEFHIQNSVLHVNLSIGIVTYPEHGNNFNELMKYADIAMYKAKEAGKNGYMVYGRRMNEIFTERVDIEKYLRTALEKNEFEIYYQPQLDLKLNKIVGFEALLRWKSAELGFVSPVKFIKVAESTHLIMPLGAWVLRNACAFLKKLHQNGYIGLTVSVNISVLQLLQTDFADMVTDILEYFDLEPTHLELEITESVLMESYETIVKRLEGLKERGVKIALDDFGKGYSSLSYLKQLPISTLKIDKSFVDDIVSSEDQSRTLTGQIVMIGNSMGLSVVAEGVENKEQLEYLIQHECHKIQGYFFSKPIPEGEVEKLLQNR